MNSLLMMDSDIPSAAFDVMARDLVEVIKNEGADEGLGDQTELLYKIADIVGERAAKDYEARSAQGYVSLGTLPELAKPLVFSNVTLKWSPKYKAFYSEGNIGISNSGKNDINGAFEGFMEIRKTEDGIPVFHVFFKASPESWYYFGIEDNRLLVHSSNKDFNSIISKKTNAGKAKIGEVAFIPGSEEETVSFINRFRKQYLDIDVPYSLYESASPVETPGPPMQITPPVDNAPVEEQKQDAQQPGVEPNQDVTPSVEEKKQDAQQPVEPGVKEGKKKKDNRKKKVETPPTQPDNKQPEQLEPEQKVPETQEPEKKKPEDEGF
jgi:hypothetical protein